MKIVAEATDLTPRMGRSLSFRNPWSRSILLVRYRPVRCRTPGTASTRPPGTQPTRPTLLQENRLSQVLRGHYRYYGRIFNHRSLSQFYQLVKRMWFKALQRRSQKGTLASAWGRRRGAHSNRLRRVPGHQI